MDRNNASQQQSFEVKTPDGLKVICIKHILYVEAARKCSIVYLDDLNTIITYHLLKWYGKYLLKPFFFRCHN
jgi:DNA-binding LytR/AlgR family response regulator